MIDESLSTDRLGRKSVHRRYFILQRRNTHKTPWPCQKRRFPFLSLVSRSQCNVFKKIQHVFSLCTFLSPFHGFFLAFNSDHYISANCLSISESNQAFLGPSSWLCNFCSASAFNCFLVTVSRSTSLRQSLTASEMSRSLIPWLWKP